MRRVFVSLFISLFVYFFISSFVASVQAICYCRTNCRANEELVDTCPGYASRYCCTITAPTATPKPAPTSSTGCNCNIPQPGDCTGATCVATTQCGTEGISCNTQDNATTTKYCNGLQCGATGRCAYSPTCGGTSQCKPGTAGCTITQVNGGCGGGTCSACYTQTGTISCTGLGHCSDTCVFDASCGTSCGPAPTNNPGPGSAPTCVDWQSITINSCTLAGFQSNPIGSNCYTPNQSVTLHLSSNAPTYMGFANVPLATACSAVPDTSFLPLEAYSTTKSWTLAAGTGTKKVCVGYVKGLLTAKCQARIIVGVAPTATPTPTATPPPTTPTPIQGPWTKLKNTSFISKNSLTSSIPLVPVSYDLDDDGSTNFIINSELIVGRPSTAGVAGAPAINITGVNIAAKTSSPNEYKVAGYSPSYLMAPDSFLSYIKARKQHTAITHSDLSEITGSGIYVYQNANPQLPPDPLDIGISNSTVFNDKNLVLISQGTINISSDFNPTGSVAIVADQIIFGNTVAQARGIFIANDITTGSTANQGLKIVGNLIAQNSLTNSRKWSNTNIPSLFIVFDQQKYINLLPYLSTANYDWRQIQ